MTRSSEMESVNSLPLTTASEEERKVILAELEAIVESGQFRSSQQCRRFLTYVVTHTLNGDDGSLRERVIGNAVFGRAPDYDTGDDPVVRLRASEVRKRLAQYYQSLDHQPGVRVQIPPGSYKAIFLWGRTDIPAHTEDQLTIAELHGSLVASEEISGTVPYEKPQIVLREETRPRGGTWRRWLWPVLAFAILLCLGEIWLQVHAVGQQRAVKNFWQPLLENPKPALISVGSNAVYRISDEVADKYGQEHNLEGSGMEFFPDFGPETTLRASGMHPASDSFVALGDVAAISQIVANLTRMQKPFQERFSNDISFAEIRSGPTILVGGFNNGMTRELTKNLRYVFVSRNRIEDRQKPGRVWVLKASQDSHDTEDYAIISRILPQNGLSPLICVAGLGQYGTLAATEFVFDQARLGEFEHLVGKDWRGRNLQILLHIKVSDFKPGPGEVVAIHTW